MNCDFDHPHPDHPCGLRRIVGVSPCSVCGNPVEGPDCDCWEPFTEADLDSLYLEAWGLS